MAKMSRAQYELLTDAMAEGMSEVLARDNAAFYQMSIRMVRKVAEYLKLDNQNFDSDLFIEQVIARAQLMRQVEAHGLQIDV